MNLRADTFSQTVILTGGIAGLGYHCAREIAASHTDWHIVLTAHNQEQAARVVRTLKREAGNVHIESMPLDLASLASIRSFTETFSSRNLPPLRAVVCNAGLQVVSGTRYTQDGFEMTFGVNCLGHFLLVNRLLRSLVAPARVVFVSSDSHNAERKSGLGRLAGAQPPRYRDPHALAWPERYPDTEEADETPQAVGMRRYSTSKLCAIFYAYELSRRLLARGSSTPASPITVTAFNPGFTPGTGLARDNTAFNRFAWGMLLPALSFALPGVSRPEKAGRELARLVLDPALENVLGKYFDRMEEKASSQESYDLQKAAELWEVSCKLVQLQPDETIFETFITH